MRKAPKSAIALLLLTGVAVLVLLVPSRDANGPVATSRTGHEAGAPDALGTPQASSETAAHGAQDREPLTKDVTFRVVDAAGTGIAGATVMLCERIERVSRAEVCRPLGDSGKDGIASVPASTLFGFPSACVAARAGGYLPASIPVSQLADDMNMLVLATASHHAVRCTDLQGAPLEGIVIMLSRLGIPASFCDAGLDPDLQPGLDPLNALYARSTDADGRADFAGLMPGRYQIQTGSEYFENVDRSQLSIEVPGPETAIRLTTLLCAVARVEGDELCSWSTAGDARDFLVVAPNGRSLQTLRKRLRERFPGAAVFACGCKSATPPAATVSMDLFLARTGKRHVEVPLAPAFEQPMPLVVEIPADAAGRETIASVEFRVRDAAGRAVPCSEFHAWRNWNELRLEMPLPVDKRARLPLGQWSIGTRSDLLKNHFQPVTIDLARAEESVEIRLDVELVPVRIVARGYRGEALSRGLIQFSQFGLHDGKSSPDLDNLTLWLRPGETEWSCGAFGYERVERVEPVLVLPDGQPQSILFDLKLAGGR